MQKNGLPAKDKAESCLSLPFFYIPATHPPPPTHLPLYGCCFSGIAWTSKLTTELELCLRRLQYFFLRGRLITGKA